MLSVIKRLVAARPKEERPIECIFSLNPQKRRLMLFDLKSILDSADARLALPNVGNLEATVARNRERIRIPYQSMLVLVKELVSVRRKIPDHSPLREIMSAIPGLVHTAMLDPMPTSTLMDGRDTAIRVMAIPGAEQEAEVQRIQEIIAQRRKTRPADEKVATPATPPAAPPPAAPAATVATEPAAVSATLVGNSRNMLALDQRRFVESSAGHIQAVALSTQELSDEDFSGYVDLCILNGDQERVIDMLIERVEACPRAWSWARLMELADSARHPRIGEFRQRFRDWAVENHPQLVPDMLGDAGSKLFFGLRNEPLRLLERRELGIAGDA